MGHGAEFQRTSRSDAAASGRTVTPRLGPRAGSRAGSPRPTGDPQSDSGRSGRRSRCGPPDPCSGGWWHPPSRRTGACAQAFSTVSFVLPKLPDMCRVLRTRRRMVLSWHAQRHTYQCRRFSVEFGVRTERQAVEKSKTSDFMSRDFFGKPFIVAVLVPCTNSNRLPFAGCKTTLSTR